MNRQPIIRGHRLPGMTVSRGSTSPVTVQRVVQVGDTPANAITTTTGNQTVQGTWRWVPVGTDEVTTLVVGNLNGYYDYVAATYGVAIGEYAASRPNITIDNVNGLRIRNYDANVLTLDLSGNATFAGEITAGSGAIGGWTIGVTNLTGGDATLDSAGALSLGTGNDVVVLDAADASYRLWAGNASGASAPFSVTKAGVLTAQGATIEGALTATTGALVNLDVSGVLDLVAGGAIQSDGYSAGMAGWRVDYDGNAEFSDITARGTIKTAVFEKGTVAATAGSILVTKSAGKLAAEYTVGGTLTIEDSDAGGFLFETNDVIRITAVNTVGNLTTTWITVTRTGTTNVYTTAYASGTSGVAYPAGTVALDYGVSGDGLLVLTADDANGPFYSVRTHAGAPYTTLSEHLRLGNLNGFLNYSTDAYGIAIGDSTANAWMAYDPDNGLRISGDALLEGTVTVDQLSILGKELIVNGGFESPLEVGWSVADMVGTRTTAQHYSGSYSLAVADPASGAALAGLQYVYGVIPGNTLIASVCVLGVAAGGRVRVDVEYYNSAGVRIGVDREEFAVTASWVKRVLSGRILAGTSYVKFVLWVFDDVQGAVYFDDASLKMRGGVLETVDTDLESAREFIAPGAAEYQWCYFYSRAFDRDVKEHIAIQHDVPAGWQPGTDVIVEVLFGGKSTIASRTVAWGMNYNYVGVGGEAGSLPYTISGTYSGNVDDSIVSRVILPPIPAAHVVSDGKMVADFYRDPDNDNYENDACLIAVRFIYTMQL